MRDLVRGLGAALFVLGARHFRPGAYHRGIRPPQVVVHFRDLQGGQQLPLAYAVADIDVDFFDISGDFRHHVHFLVRPEFGGQHQAVRQVLGGSLDDGHGRNLVGCTLLACTGACLEQDAVKYAAAMTKSRA